MILPIYIYGHPVLRKKANPVTKDLPNLKSIIDNMFETMYNAKGVGLAAPQVGKSIRLFIVDAAALSDDTTNEDFKGVFINPVINTYFGDDVALTEGCLSIPELQEKINRKSKVSISYYDKKWNYKENCVYEGWTSRIIQHEYDHLRGILFTDKLSILRRKLLSNKLQEIAKGKFVQNYEINLTT